MKRKPFNPEKEEFSFDDVSGVERIPFLEGRPSRTRIIEPDDQLNLQIALNTARTLEEFIEMI